MIPGQRYDAKIDHGTGCFSGMAVENLVLTAGEVRDPGDVRMEPSVEVNAK